jgi:hypothetical protein
MRERERHSMVITAAETMHQLWELESHAQELDLDNVVRRLKDLSAYSVTRAEIIDQRGGKAASRA